MINWTAILAELESNISKQIRNILIALFVLLAITLIIKLINKLTDYILGRRNKLTGKFIDEMRRKTLAYLLKNITTYVLYGIGVFYILTLFFGSVGVTVAGVGSVAIGFGAQGMIKDIISGIFILVEDKFKIGDYVKVGSLQGFVEQIGMRTTVLRDYNGDINIIPNGNIEEITNYTRSDRRFVVEIMVSNEESMDKIAKAIEEAIEDFKSTHDKISDGPTFLGITDMKETAITLRVQGKTSYAHFYNYETDLRKTLLHYFQKYEIKSPKFFRVQQGETKW